MILNRSAMILIQSWYSHCPRLSIVFHVIKQRHSIRCFNPITPKHDIQSNRSLCLLFDSRRSGRLRKLRELKDSMQVREIQFIPYEQLISE